jgi:metalloendopeptidase OMA1, mitochondrial
MASFLPARLAGANVMPAHLQGDGLRLARLGHDHMVPRLTRRGFIMGGTALLCYGCATAPITGRSQFMVISQAQETALGVQAYREVITKAPVTHDPKALVPLQRIVSRLAPMAEAAAGRSDFQWEVNVIKDDKTVNAFVLPGGKIVVYTGIFPIAQTEAGMAVILGHEMGHAIARHAGERLSQQLGTQIAGTALAVGVGGSAYSNAIMTAFGLGSQYGLLLPYSRVHEAEADSIGLILAAKAGYDPNVAVGVWERMAKLPGQRPPEFLSTHPAPESRITNIKRELPQAMAEFRPNPDPGNTPLSSPQEIAGPSR